MKSFLRMSLILCGASLLPLSQAYASSPPVVVAESARTVAGGRSVEVTVGQAELKSNINNVTAVVPAAGGLLGALIVAGVAAKIEADRAKKAEIAITPLRDALSDFDADGLALSTTKGALDQVDWLKTDNVQFSKDSTPLGKSNFLDSGDAAQAAFFDYTYDLAPDFSSIRVNVSLEFANKASVGSKPEARLNYNKLAYTQSITTVVPLPNMGTDINANAQAWTADHGRLARLALTTAFADIEKLIPRTLALTDADVKAMNGKDKTKQTLNGYFGRTQESDGSHTLLWGGGFIDVEALPPEAPRSVDVVESTPTAPEAQAPADAPAAPAADTPAPAASDAPAPATPDAQPETQAPADPAAQPQASADTAAPPPATPQAQ